MFACEPGLGLSAAASHISQKTSEIWGTPGFFGKEEEQTYAVRTALGSRSAGWESLLINPSCSSL